MEVSIGLAGEGDMAFIRDSWLRSYRYSPEVRGVPVAEYWHHCGDRVDRLLGSSSLRIARPVDWDEGIIGWVCYSPTCVHYIYVKTAYRRRGVGQQLLTSDRNLLHKKFSHLRPPYSDWLRRRGLSYNAWLKEG